jgi:phage terminase large subunit GpA-like protein
MERFYIPCHQCGHMQHLVWEQVQWTTAEDATYQCIHCDAHWNDVQRWAAVRLGEWRAENPESKTRGFHLNEIYSPWTALAAMVEAYLEAKPHPEQLKAWTNTALAKTWEQKGVVDINVADWADERGEVWKELPERALVVTAGVDVQGGQRARLEVEIVAWSEDKESWSLGYYVIVGDPKLPVDHAASPWKKLDKIFSKTYLHESGHLLPVSAVCVDSGYLPDSVYAYTKPRERRGYVATKGLAGQGSPVIRTRSRNNEADALLLALGVDTLKSHVYDRLDEDIQPGEPGYCHFPPDRDANYYEGLTAETPLPLVRKGFQTIVWTLPAGKMNEPLDCRALATAALEYRAPKWNQIRRRLQVAVTGSPPPPRRATRRRQISSGL